MARRWTFPESCRNASWLAVIGKVDGVLGICWEQENKMQWRRMPVALAAAGARARSQPHSRQASIAPRTFSQPLTNRSAVCSSRVSAMKSLATPAQHDVLLKPPSTMTSISCVLARAVQTEARDISRILRASLRLILLRLTLPYPNTNKYYYIYKYTS